MYEHAATRANLETLRARGVEVLEPGTGALGSPGEWGVGRLPEPAELLAAVEARLGSSPGGSLDGLNVLITAGGTREPIDAVRFVGNRSSGKMGWALAEEAARRGARVTVVAANVALPRTPGIEYADVATAAELGAACAERFPAADVLLMAAAVADYRPAAARADKIKKTEAGDTLAIELERTEDVLSGLAAQRRPDQLLVGFAAEAGEGALGYAREKLERKRLDAVVLNDVSRPGIAFDAPDNEVTILTAEGERHVPRASKAEVAGAVLDSVLSLRSSSRVRVS
jgi:phosphopantothenoylcysteine decarboxylase/phosphopantothenate--cysteine ligase